MNAAVAAARLGAPTAFLGRVSTDAFGTEIWTHLEASGVRLELAERGPEPTARAIVETHPVQRFTFEGEATADSSMVSFDSSRIGRGNHILHGGTLGIFRGSTAEVLACLVEEFEGVVSFDPNVRPAIIDQVGADTWWFYANRWLDRADLVRGSDEDFDWMGVSIGNLLDRGAKAVVKTLGADGAEVHLASGEVVVVSADVIDFVDAVGAGDSFCGALLVRLYTDGWPEATKAWGDMLRFACAVAGDTCSRPGADPPWWNQMSTEPFTTKDSDGSR